MPWKETCIMDEKVHLISDWLTGEYSKTELSTIYEVSRPTVYKWINRYEEEGVTGLEEQPRVPLNQPNATPSEIAEMIINTKLQHQYWGPKKIIAWLNINQPWEQWPAASTAGEILRKEGLVSPRKKRRRTPPYMEPFKGCDKPNDVWSADYKGEFRTKDGKVCYPLTITDNSSRYLLECRALSHPTHELTQPWFEWAFREYGLPEAIRTDNGVPFASVSLGGLSKLSIWFIKLGIRPERIKPGHPEQNGRHERMHRTLKQETTKPPMSNLRTQQQAFNKFRNEYNMERPNEALKQHPPASMYRPSQRVYTVRLPKVEYDEGVMVRRVRHNGEIKWKGDFIYVSQTLAKEPVSLEQIDDHLWEVKFRFYSLGTLNEVTGKVLPHEKKQNKKVRRRR